MSTRKCPHCGADMIDDMNLCLVCMEQAEKPLNAAAKAPDKRKHVRLLIAVLAFVVIVGAIAACVLLLGKDNAAQSNAVDTTQGSVSDETQASTPTATSAPAETDTPQKTTNTPAHETTLTVSETTVSVTEADTEAISAANEATIQVTEITEAATEPADISEASSDLVYDKYDERAFLCHEDNIPCLMLKDKDVKRASIVLCDNVTAEVFASFHDNVLTLELTAHEKSANYIFSFQSGEANYTLQAEVMFYDLDGDGCTDIFPAIADIQRKVGADNSTYMNIGYSNAWCVRYDNGFTLDETVMVAVGERFNVAYPSWERALCYCDCFIYYWLDKGKLQLYDSLY